jgi:hypothetical protein
MRNENWIANCRLNDDKLSEVKNDIPKYAFTVRI